VSPSDRSALPLRRPTLSTQRPTLADVAATAGVSVSTASLAFSGAGPIAEATRRRVLDAAAELDYSGPNPLGRQLRRGRSGIVGVVLGDALRRSFRDPMTIQVLDGLVSTLAPLDQGVLLVPTSAEPTTPDPLVESAAMDVAVVMDGVTSDHPVLAALHRRGVPTVLVEAEPAADTAWVGIDDRAGTARLATHLRDLGHERIACVTLPYRRERRAGLVPPDAPPPTGPITARRLAGLADAGVQPVAVYETAGSLVEHGASAGRALLTMDPHPTAVVGQSDLLAAGVVLAARELGLRVPQDVSVAGFDGIDLPWLGPDSLTTVVQPLADKGVAIAHAVEDVLADLPPTHRVLPVELRIGSTTGPAAAS